MNRGYNNIIYYVDNCTLNLYIIIIVLLQLLIAMIVINKSCGLFIFLFWFLWWFYEFYLQTTILCYNYTFYIINNF